MLCMRTVRPLVGGRRRANDTPRPETVLFRKRTFLEEEKQNLPRMSRARDRCKHYSSTATCYLSPFGSREQHLQLHVAQPHAYEHQALALN